jgi:hypothetical protein
MEEKQVPYDFIESLSLAQICYLQFALYLLINKYITHFNQPLFPFT